MEDTTSAAALVDCVASSTWLMPRALFFNMMVARIDAKPQGLPRTAETFQDEPRETMKLSTFHARCLANGSFVVAAMLSLSTNAAAADPAKGALAAQICNAGTGKGFGHPSNACWTAYEIALRAGDYGAALAAVRAGCRYGRADFCMFAAKVGVTPATIAGVTGAVDRYRIRRAFENAEALVTVQEMDDAEAPLIWAEAKVLRERNPRAGMRLARHAPRTARSQEQ